MSEIEDLLESMLGTFRRTIEPGDMSPRGRGLARGHISHLRSVIVQKWVRMETQIAWLRAQNAELVAACKKAWEVPDQEPNGLGVTESRLLRMLPTVIATAGPGEAGGERVPDGLGSRAREAQETGENHLSYPQCPFCGFRVDRLAPDALEAFRDHMGRCPFHPAGAEVQRLREALEAVVYYTGRQDEDGNRFPLNADEVDYLDGFVHAALEEAEE